MKKVALVFVVAVILPSLVLAWLAVRSLRDQQFLLERQQSLIDQHATDALAQNISDYLAQQQQEFSAQVESLAATGDVQKLAAQFDDQLRRRWPLAEVGFCVTAAGKILSPLPNARSEAQMFRLDNSGFLGNREPVEVYWNANNGAAGGVNGANNTVNNLRNSANQSSIALNNFIANPGTQAPQPRQQLRTAEPAVAPSVAPTSGQNANIAVNNFSNVSFGDSNVGNAGAKNTLNNFGNQGNQSLFTLNNNSASFPAQAPQQQRQQWTAPEPPAGVNPSAPASQNAALAANNIRNGAFGGGGGGRGGGGGEFFRARRAGPDNPDDERFVRQFNFSFTTARIAAVRRCCGQGIWTRRQLLPTPQSQQAPAIAKHCHQHGCRRPTVRPAGAKRVQLQDRAAAQCQSAKPGFSSLREERRSSRTKTCPKSFRPRRNSASSSAAKTTACSRAFCKTNSS